MARQSGAKPDIDILILVGGDPDGALHVVLAHHRARFHRRVDFVAGAVEEAGVDEERRGPFAAAMQAARLTVVRRSSSMMPILTVLRARPSTSSTRAKISLAKATSSGPCIFGLTI